MSDDDDEDEDDGSEEGARASVLPAQQPTMLTPRQPAPYAMSPGSRAPPAVQPNNLVRGSPSGAASGAATVGPRHGAPPPCRHPPPAEYPYGDGDKSDDGGEEVELGSMHGAAGAGVPRLNIRRPQPPPPSSSTTAAAAAAGDRPQTRDKLPPDARAAREAIAARLALGSPLRQPSPGPPHQHRPRQPRHEFGEGNADGAGGEEEDFDFAVEPPSMDASMDGDDEEEAGAVAAAVFRSRPPPGDDYYHGTDGPRSRGMGASRRGGDGGRRGGRDAPPHKEAAARDPDDEASETAAARPDSAALPALGVQFFRELLTPRLGEEELARRVRGSEASRRGYRGSHA